MSFFRKYSKEFFFIFIFILAGYLRLHNYVLYPQRGATSDEYAFAFQGLSLLSRGVPISWSAIPLYVLRENLTIRGLFFPLVTPYLDHPPFFGLLVGAWSMMMGQQAFESVSLATIRLLPILFSLAALFFVYAIGRNIHGEIVARWAALIYGTTTLFVINSRLVVAESLITLLLLWSVSFCFTHSKKITWKTAGVLGALAGFSFLSKILGIVTFFSLCILLIKARIRRVELTVFLAVFSIFVIGLVLYGVSIGGEFFWKIQAYQGGRVVTPQTLWTILTTPIIVNKIYYSGWYYWGLLSCFFVLSALKKYMQIAIPAGIYFILLLFSVNTGDIHGWYYIPFFPFFSLCGAILLYEGIQKMQLTVIAFMIIVFLSQLGLLYEQYFGLTTSVFRVLGAVVLLPLTGAWMFQWKSFYRSISIGFFYLAILINILLTWSYVHPG